MANERERVLALRAKIVAAERRYRADEKQAGESSLLESLAKLKRERIMELEAVLRESVDQTFLGMGLDTFSIERTRIVEQSRGSEISRGILYTVRYSNIPEPEKTDADPIYTRAVHLYYFSGDLMGIGDNLTMRNVPLVLTPEKALEPQWYSPTEAIDAMLDPNATMLSLQDLDCRPVNTEQLSAALLLGMANPLSTETGKR